VAISYPRVFSELFVLNNPDTGYSTYQVPAGFVAVIRDFSIFAIDALSLGNLAVSLSEVAPLVIVASLGAIGETLYAQWQGRVVVPAGGFIVPQLAWVGTGPHCYVGGYLLTAPASS